MALAQNLAAAEKVIKEIKKLVPKGSSNKIFDRLRAAGGIDKVIAKGKGFDENRTLMKEVYYARKDAKFTLPPNPKPLDRIISWAQSAIASKAGNCMEQAALCFLGLVVENALPVDYMMFTNEAKERGKPLYDHAWVVVGRVAGSKLDDCRSWGPDAVWCDAWQGDDGMAYSLKDFIAGKVRNTNALFRLDTVERINEGKPDSFLRMG